MADPDARDAMRDLIEPGAIAARPDHDGQIRLSVAISLKRLADVAEGFTDHPDRRNDYGEFGLAALMGELRRFKQEVVNDVSSFLHRR